MKKRYVLKNRKRFFTILSMLFIFTFVLISISSVYADYADREDPEDFITVTVGPGDTLWDIAKQYNQRGDIRKYIYEIMKLNDLKTSRIYAGETLKIPNQ